MAKCVNCGSGGMFAKMDTNGLCKDCATKKRNLVEEVNGILSLVDIVNDTVKTIINLCDKDNVCEKAVGILQEATNKAKTATLIVSAEKFDYEKDLKTIKTIYEEVSELSSQATALIAESV